MRSGAVPLDVSTRSYEGGDPPYALFTIVVFEFSLPAWFFSSPSRMSPGARAVPFLSRTATLTALQQEGAAWLC